MKNPRTFKRLSIICALALGSTFASTTAHAEEAVAVPPSAPQRVTVAVKGARALVAWTAPASSGDWPVAGYTASTSPGDLSCVTTVLSCTISGLVRGQTYSVTVRADSAAGLGLLSEKVNIAVPYAFESQQGTTAKVTAPVSSFATHAVVRTTAGMVNVGLRTPRASTKAAQIIRYTVQLFDSAGAVVAKGANGAQPAKPATVAVAAGAGTYRVYVTAQKRNGGKVTWEGPRVTVG